MTKLYMLLVLFSAVGVPQSTKITAVVNKRTVASKSSSSPTVGLLQCRALFASMQKSIQAFNDRYKRGTENLNKNPNFLKANADRHKQIMDYVFKKYGTPTRTLEEYQKMQTSLSTCIFRVRTVADLKAASKTYDEVLSQMVVSLGAEEKEAKSYENSKSIDTDLLESAIEMDEESQREKEEIKKQYAEADDNYKGTVTKYNDLVDRYNALVLEYAGHIESDRRSADLLQQQLQQANSRPVNVYVPPSYTPPALPMPLHCTSRTWGDGSVHTTCD